VIFENSVLRWFSDEAFFLFFRYCWVHPSGALTGSYNDPCGRKLSSDFIPEEATLHTTKRCIHREKLWTNSVSIPPTRVYETRWLVQRYFRFLTTALSKVASVKPMG